MWAERTNKRGLQLYFVALLQQWKYIKKSSRAPPVQAVLRAAPLASMCTSDFEVAYEAAARSGSGGGVIDFVICEAADLNGDAFRGIYDKAGAFTYREPGLDGDRSKKVPGGGGAGGSGSGNRKNPTRRFGGDNGVGRAGFSADAAALPPIVEAWKALRRDGWQAVMPPLPPSSPLPRARTGGASGAFAGAFNLFGGAGRTFPVLRRPGR
jgi:hypothetical protein